MRQLEEATSGGGTCSSDSGGKPAAGGAMQQSLPAPASTPPSQQHMAFLQGWQALIAPKIRQLLTLLAGQEVARNLAVAQVWTYLPVLIEGRQLLKAEQLCLLGDSQLQAFHDGCCQEGVTVSQLGPMGKVWENGAVQVVQCAASLGGDVHPRNRLQGPLGGRIEECIYVPVYDSTGQVSQGVLAVVELLVRSGSHDYMVVANAISCLAHIMDALQLSLSNPHAQQQQQGAAAPASPGINGKGGLAAAAAQQQAQLQRASAPSPPPSGVKMAAGSPGGINSSPAKGGLGRTISVRTFT